MTQPRHCPSSEMHKTPENYAFWQQVWAEICKHHNRQLAEVYYGHVLRTMKSKIDQVRQDLVLLEQALETQQKAKENAPHRTKELKAILVSAASSNMPPLQRDLYNKELEELANIQNRIKTTKTRITKLKKDITALETEFSTISRDEAFKSNCDNHVATYIMKYGYMQSAWHDIEHLLPPNTPIYKG